jgi:hypothetical protein
MRPEPSPVTSTLHPQVLPALEANLLHPQAFIDYDEYSWNCVGSGVMETVGERCSSRRAKHLNFVYPFDGGLTL